MWKMVILEPDSSLKKRSTVKLMHYKILNNNSILGRTGNEGLEGYKIKVTLFSFGWALHWFHLHIFSIPCSILDSIDIGSRHDLAEIGVNRCAQCCLIETISSWCTRLYLSAIHYIIFIIHWNVFLLKMGKRYLLKQVVS